MATTETITAAEAIKRWRDAIDAEKAANPNANTQWIEVIMDDIKVMDAAGEFPPRFN